MPGHRQVQVYEMRVRAPTLGHDETSKSPPFDPSSPHAARANSNKALVQLLRRDFSMHLAALAERGDTDIQRLTLAGLIADALVRAAHSVLSAVLSLLCFTSTKVPILTQTRWCALRIPFSLRRRYAVYLLY